MELQLRLQHLMPGTLVRRLVAAPQLLVEPPGTALPGRRRTTWSSTAAPDGGLREGWGEEG